MVRRVRGPRSLFFTFLCGGCSSIDGKNAEALSPLKMRKATLSHALIIIFLEYFSWGLLTVPVINVLAETFPNNKFLMNGLILGLKGLLSFFSAPLIGALSDVCGRKRFLLLTLFCTCMPIPCLIISPWWYFTLFTLSGLFSVTFSVVLAYVADITEKQDRVTACGFVSATFAASLVTSPALGSWMSTHYSDNAVVLFATIVFLIDILFIVFFVPESLRHKAGGGCAAQSLEEVGWQNADPFLILRLVGEDRTVFRLSAIVFLSYLPEAGQFSCFFVYLKLVVGFSPDAVAAFIGFVGILSAIAQTGILSMVTRRFGAKQAINLGLMFQFLQLVWYGIGTQYWMMWSAGLLAALSQMSYPAISAFVSLQAERELQGTVQGVLSAVRGLCQGMGPAVFGFFFYLFDMDLSADDESTGHIGVGPQFPVPNIRLQPFIVDNNHQRVMTPTRNSSIVANLALPSLENAGRYLNRMIEQGLIPGPPFLFGALLVFIALFVNMSLPVGKKIILRRHRKSPLLSTPSTSSLSPTSLKSMGSEESLASRHHDPTNEA